MKKIIISIIIVLIIVIIFLYLFGYIKLRKQKTNYEDIIGYEYNDDVQNLLNDSIKIDKDKHKITTDTADKYINNSYILASLYRFNVAPKLNKDKVIQHYNDAINMIIDYPKTQNSDLIINKAEEYLTFEHPVEYNFNNIKTIIRNKKKLKPNERKMQNNFYNPKPIYNDPQNVHDSQVSNDIKFIYQKILDKNQMNNISLSPHYFDDIKSDLIKHNMSDEEKDRALFILNKFKQKNEYMNLNTTDDQILLNVWARINSPENNNQRQSLKVALFDALSNSMDKNYRGEYKEVCLQGRCNRVLQSLTLLDNDQNISAPIKTIDILKNEIMSKSYQVIQKILSNSPKHIVDMYNNGSESNELKNFESDLKNEIEKTLRIDYPNVDKSILDPIILDAQSGV